MSYRTEADLMHAIMLELSSPDIRIFRNSVGGMHTADGRFLTFGLAVGSSDLIGLAKGRGRFIAIETKLPGNKATREQQAFLDMVKSFGGLAGVAHSIEEAKAIIDGGQI